MHYKCTIVFTFGLKIRKSWFTLTIIILMSIAQEFQAKAQKSTYLEAGYSVGILRSKVMDEWDNSIVYGHSAFQPLQVYLKFVDDKWSHRLSFYYAKNKLSPISGSELFSYNEVTSESGELAYDALHQIYHPAESGFSLCAGAGIRAFGSFRARKSKSYKYPYEDNVNAYDINAGSLQVLVSPVFKKNKSFFSLTVSMGLVNYVIRPDSYNPRFDSNNDKWLLVSLDKHFNMHHTLTWKYQISEKIFLDLDYRFFYYKYSFPYPLKVLNQHYLIGLSYKF